MRVLHVDDERRHPPEARIRAMAKKKKQEGNRKRVWRKDIGVRIWEVGVKSRELSGNGRTKETKLVYKSVALLYQFKIDMDSIINYASFVSFATSYLIQNASCT